MTDAAEAALPYRTAPLGALVFDTSVIVITHSAGGWRVTGVLERRKGQPPQVHPAWPERWSSDPDVTLEAEWDYLAGRIVDGSYGNGMTYELEGFEVDDPRHIERLVNARNAEIVASSHGPLGETVGTFNSEWSVDEVYMPFVVVANDDDRRRLVLVAAQPDITKASVTGPDGTMLVRSPLRSVELWQRSGADSWNLDVPGHYRVTWSKNLVGLDVYPDGAFRLYTPPRE